MKQVAINGDEIDWICKGCRRSLCLFKNNTGLGKKVKKAMNRRSRAESRVEIVKDIFENVMYKGHN